MLLFTKFGKAMSNISSDIEQNASFICHPLKWAVTLKLRLRSRKLPCDLEIKVKIEHGLPLALVLLCTKFGEDTSTISSDIERKPYFIWHHLK